MEFSLCKRRLYISKGDTIDVKPRFYFYFLEIPISNIQPHSGTLAGKNKLVLINFFFQWLSKLMASVLFSRNFF